MRILVIFTTFIAVSLAQQSWTGEGLPDKDSFADTGNELSDIQPLINEDDQDFITIDGPDETKPGDNVTMTCKAKIGNSPVEVTWMVDGHLKQSESEVTQTASGKWLTSSTITVNVTKQDHNSKIFTCYALNRDLGKTTTKSFSVNILHAPDPPAIFGYEEGTAIHAGKLQRLTCISHGGNPLPELKWFKGEEEIESSQASIIGTIISKELVLIPEANDNGAIYKCKSLNTAAAEPLVSSITLTVYFPPSLPSITVKPNNLIAGSEIELSCECNNSNPAAKIIWWSSNSKDEILSATTNTVVNASDHQGFISKSVLHFNVTAKDNESKITCQATNEAIQQSSDNAIDLFVKYKPLIKDWNTYKSILSDQDKKAELQCLAEGLPDVTFSWIFKGNIVSSENTRINQETTKLDNVTWKNILTIEEVKMQDFGEYQCVARNEIGSDTANITLIPDGAPDSPLIVKATNVTSESIFIEWVPGFDGGHDQKFQVQYKCFSDSNILFIDVNPPFTNSVWIKNLKSDTEYEVHILSFNVKGISSNSTSSIKVKTLGLPKFSWKNSDELTVPAYFMALLIGAILTIFVLLLLLIIVLVALHYQKKKIVNSVPVSANNKSSQGIEI